MRKVFLLLLCCCWSICANYHTAKAQCLEYAAGPYSDQGAISTSGCDGTTVAAAYQAWANEVYSSTAVAGGSYTVSLGAPGACNNTAWGDDVTITVIEGGTPTDDAPPAGGPGSIVGGTVVASTTGCSLDFTATATGPVFFIFSTESSCGGAITSADNGTPTLTTNSGVSCECGNGNCNAAIGESFATCPGDCPCESAFDFLSWPDFAALTTPIIYCPEQLTDAGLGYNGGTNTDPAVVYIPFVISSDNELTSTPGDTDDAFGSLSTTEGELYASTSPPSPNAAGEASRFIQFLRLTQADIDASGGTTTITFTGDNSSCAETITITWADVLNADNIAAQCTPCNDDAGTLSGPSQVCFGETFTINSTGVSFDPASGSDGILYGVFTIDGPTAGFENDLLNDATFLGVLGDDSNNSILNDIFTDGAEVVIAPITYEGTDPNDGTYILGNCHHVGTGFAVTFIPEVTVSGFLSCNLELTAGGGIGNDGYTYSLLGPAPSTTLVASGNAESTNGYQIVYNGAAGEYSLEVTDSASGCTQSFTVTIAPNNDSAGEAFADAGDGGSTAITVCYDGAYSIGTDGAVVGSDDSFFSNILGWGISTADPSGDINAIDVAFVPTTDPTQLLNMVNNGDALSGAFNPDGTAFTGSLAPGNTYYFTPFTMFDLPGTPLGTEIAGDEFGWQGVNGGEANGDADGTVDLAYSFYVDGADPTGAGFSLTNICFDITHAYIGDVALYLVSPAGTFIQLVAADGGNDGDDMTACFTATGADPTAGCNGANPPCFSGDLASLDALTLPAGENPNGFWTILVDDTWGDALSTDGGGTFNSWSATATGGTLWNGAGNFPFPVWDGDCYKAGTTVAVTLAEPVSVTATATACGFTATSTATTDVSWQVSDSGGNVVASGTGTGSNFGGSVAADGTYTLLITDGNGCEAADEFTTSGCSVSTCPTISNFTTSLTQACSGASVMLCADVNYGTFPDATVLFSDGTTSVAGTPTGGGTPTVHTIEVGPGGFFFVPASVNAQVGDIIRWVWVDGFHTTTSTTIPAGAASWDQPLTGAGQQFEYTLTTAGTYNYVCTPHSGLGMAGTIIVSPAASTTVCTTINLSNTTCESVINNYTASFDATTIGSCSNNVLGPLGVTVYPNIVATGVNGTCSASVTVNCPNFSVSYSSPAGSGSGTTLSLTPSTTAQNGTVTFTITQLGAPAGCATATATATYACAAAACPTLSGQAVAESAICSGGALSLTNGAINGGGAGASIAWAISTDMAFDPYTSGTAYAGGALTNTGCEATTHYLKAYLTGVDGCQVSSNAFSVMVYPNIVASGVNGSCSASVTVNCPNFVVSYSSPAGSGDGNTLTLTPSNSDQIGSVTFTITQAGAPAGCATATATANYDCAATVCSSLDGLQGIDNSTLCSNSSVTLQNGGVVDGSFTGGMVAWSYSTNADFDPYTEGTAYSGQALTASGCNPTTYHFKARLTGVSGCQDVEGPFAVMVYPNIVALPVNGSCSAGVNVVGGCSNYSVSYTTSNGDSGSGSSYSLMPSTTAQSGTVTFTIINAALPVGTSCSSAEVTASYECAALLCAELDGTQGVDFSATCSGQGVGFVSGGIVANDFPGGSVGVRYSTNADFDPYTTGTNFSGSLPANNTCEPQSYFIRFYLNGVAGCQDVSDAFQVQVYPNISGTVTNSNSDICSEATVNLACPFAATWVDSQGNTGSGSSYQPADGAIGSVVFTVTQANAPGTCGSRTFTATYNCSDLLCSELDGGQAVLETTLCSGQSLTLVNGSVVDNDFTGGSVTWVYSTESGFNAYTEGTVFSGSLPANNDCQAITYFVRARLDGVAGCQDQSAESAVRVYPNITATAIDGTCSASVEVNCGNFTVTYSTSVGESGNGDTFNAALGESGTVTFTITQTDAPAACAVATATASFDCPLLLCSELDGTQAVNSAAVCSGASLSLTNGAVVDNSYTGGTVTWVYGTTSDFDAYTDGMLLEGTLPTNSGCDAMTYYVKARLDGVAECQDQSGAFAVMVYPAIVAEVTADACNAMVVSECTYEITWQNTSSGQSGSGSMYMAEPGESSVVIFTISQSGAPAACGSLSLFAELNCPEIPCTPNDAGTCSLSLLSLVEGRTDACSGDGIVATATGVAVNDPNYVAGFILYTDPTDPAGSLLAANSDGVFLNDGTLPTNQTLYISSAVLAIPFASNFEASCNHISEPQDALFLTPLTAEIVGYDCDFEADTYTVTFTVSGGDGNYSANGMAFEGDTYTSEAIANGGAFDFQITDGAGCTTAISGDYLCVVAPEPPTAENATYTQSVLQGGVAYFLADLTGDANGDVLSYDILSYEPESAGTLEFDAASGSFTFAANPDAVGQSLVITYTVSDGVFDPVQGTITINITDQLTCELLAPISITTSINVNPLDPSDLRYSVYVNTTGGLPDIDDTEYTITLNDGTNSLVQSAEGSSVILFANIPAATVGLTLTITATDELGCSATISEDVSVVLAVEMLRFDGEVLDNGNLLRWTTASEINNDNFTLLRSTDGIAYTAIATLDGAGNSSQALNYEWLDKTAPNGISYYRLTQTDFDGTTHIAGNVALTRNAKGLVVANVSPIPATDVLTINFGSVQSGITVATVFDATGRQVASTRVSDGNQLAIDVAQYAAGTYFVTLQNSAGTTAVQFVKQ
ncbi:MAG: T9SS type A sorting domain-containing protein [Chitinophagales bacterium]|nr:T9SS type A sorting domain-containing protein [Chitinophagales bacterium]